MATKSTSKKPKTPSERSPRYPSISLPEAIEKAKLLYLKEKRTLVPRVIAVTAWGYNTLHGRSLTMLASLTQYGLLTRQGGNVGISEDAFVILGAPRDSKERKDALERCSRTPRIFDEILQIHPNELPSDDTLTWDLKQRGFTDAAAKVTIECLRDTISLVNDEMKDYNGGKEIDEEEQADNTETRPMPLTTKKLIQTSHAPWNFPLHGKTAFVSIAGGEPVQEDIDLLIEYLKTFKKQFDKGVPGIIENNENE